MSTQPTATAGNGAGINYAARTAASGTKYENSNRSGSGRPPSQRARPNTPSRNGAIQPPILDGHGRISQRIQSKPGLVLPESEKLKPGDIVSFWMIKHCLLDAYQRRKHHPDGTWEFADTDKCVLQFQPNDYIRNRYGQDWPHGFSLESRDGLVVGVSYDDSIATVDILPFFSYSGKGAWQDDGETIPKSPEFCASHLSIMTRIRLDRRMRYEARIKQQRAMNPNSDVKMSMNTPTPNSHPWAPFDCIAVVNQNDSYDPKRNTLVRFSMVLTMNVDARVRKHSSLEPESKIRTLDIYRKWLYLRMISPEERSTGDYGPYTWLRGMDPSYTGSLTTPEIGATNAAPQQTPIVPQQNGNLPRHTGPAVVATPPQTPTVPHHNGVLPHPTGTTNPTPQQGPGAPHQNGALPPPPGLGVVTPPWMKRKFDDTEGNTSVNAEQQAAMGDAIATTGTDSFGTQAADSSTSLEPASKRQKTEANADEADTDVGVTPGNPAPLPQMRACDSRK
ncbi:hypothetical protein J4E83_005997 [Alternaria metachromatica]|uniref:uncharacterized protein n=1 Tax=Alternaria metachromatica TaxID=283354 RepID=UPI0020C211B8|nr:uncharacterized protein J4E83_005997 [Alternaria metachromatica]KAI4619045.1 hypothetical protein J4E83_005997 [Alternaria metachromatica]